jgi:hypothetical protein
LAAGDSYAVRIQESEGRMQNIQNTQRVAQRIKQTPLSNCPLVHRLKDISLVHCPLSIVHCPLSIVHCPLSMFWSEKLRANKSMKKSWRCLIVRWKLLIIILLVVVAAFVSLDFVPVKHAKVVDTIYNEANITELSEDIDILAAFTYKTVDLEYPWEAYYRENSDYYLVIFKIKGNNPYQQLSRRDFYNKNKLASTNIRFMLSGKLTLEEREYYIGEFDISAWEIVYPIERKSFRKNYAPKSYLTIYDFDWLEVIKNWLS